MTEQVYPNNIDIHEADRERAKIILSDPTAVIINYLREHPVVGLSIKQPRDENDAIIEDALPIKRRIVCSGKPYACLVAFVDDDELRIGWSKRIESKKLVKTTDLLETFRAIRDGRANSFDEFVAALVSLMKDTKVKDLEIPFSKREARIAAVIRGLNDSIIIRGKSVKSAASGIIPSEVARMLPNFIQHAERVFDGTANNVDRSRKEIGKALAASAF